MDHVMTPPSSSRSAKIMVVPRAPACPAAIAGAFGSIGFLSASSSGSFSSAWMTALCAWRMASWDGGWPGFWTCQADTAASALACARSRLRWTAMARACSRVDRRAGMERAAPIPRMGSISTGSTRPMMPVTRPVAGTGW
ncbi:MAG TPA: hypothetical protein DHV93_08580 [Holophagaceae bacterium]|nr:hypothetical protein [Holophagaceae bacterium]